MAKTVQDLIQDIRKFIDDGDGSILERNKISQDVFTEIIDELRNESRQKIKNDVKSKLSSLIEEGLVLKKQEIDFKAAVKKQETDFNNTVQKAEKSIAKRIQELADAVEKHKQEEKEVLKNFSSVTKIEIESDPAEPENVEEKVEENPVPEIK